MSGGRLTARLIILGGFAAGLAVTAALALWTVKGSKVGSGTANERPLEGLQVFGAVPPFSLIERSGKPVTRDDLMGKVWIVNFFYTHCPDTCPVQTANMARLQRDLKDSRNFYLVSITVDPERDTPPVLREYADRYGADAARWLFLTGQKKAIYRLAQEGFRLSVVDPQEGMRGWLFGPSSAFAHHGETGKQVMHSSRFVLVDRQVQIRGYYQNDDEEALQRLRRDVRSLLQEEK